MSLPTNFPYGAQPDIIRANQKDVYYQTILQQHLSRVIQQFLGPRFQHIWQKEINTFSDICYFGLTTLMGTQTLGEEYCDIVQINVHTHTYPSKMRRFCLFFAQSLLPYIYHRSRIELKRKHQDRFLSIQEFIFNHLKPIHLAIFYFFGAYYSLSKRFTGIRYIFTRQLEPHEKRVGYEILGLLITLQLVIQTIVYMRTERVSDQVVEEDDYDFIDHIEEDKSYEQLQMLKCALCLETRKATTATPCGHLFCWSCIIEWCQNKPECPLCRSDVKVCHLVSLNNF